MNERPIHHLFAVILLLAVALPAQAVSEPDGRVFENRNGGDISEIHVVGRTINFAVNSKLLRKIEKQFHEKRPIYAPQANLRYRIIASEAQETDNVIISIMDGKQTIMIRPQAGGFINLPAAAFKKGAIITANKSSSSIELLPEVMSPQFSDEKRRMGDLRLQCRLMWVLKSPSVPLPVKTAFGLAGGVCNSKKIEISFSAHNLIRKATLIQPNQKPTDVAIKDGIRYRPPIYDKRVSNDSSIILH